MSPRDPVFAMLVNDGAEVRMRRGDWNMTFPVADLDRWIGFYDRMCRRANGQHEKHHKPSLEALLKVKAKLKAKEKAG